jgi:hypothetical protein
MTETGWDPLVKKYFRKIMNSFALGLLWMLAVMTAGLYFKLGFVAEGVRWYNLVFYVFFAGSFGSLLWYYYRTWKD